jgi:type IV pilus assembly protein PilQ
MDRYPTSMRKQILAVLFLCCTASAQTAVVDTSDNTPDIPAENTGVDQPVLQIAPPTESGPIEVQEGEADVDATDYGTFNLNARDIDLTQILEMLSEVSHRNILAGRDVTATVSVNLYDVTFDEALKAVLEVADCGSIEEGNFIYVHPREHVEQVLQARRKRATRVFELYYLSAKDAAEITIPLLSEGGTAVALGDVDEGFLATVEVGGTDSWAFSARLVVNDYEPELEAIAEILKDLDLPPSQVQVEAAILLASVRERNGFGVDFSFVTSMNFSDFAGPLGPLTPVSPVGIVNNLLGGETSSNNVVAGQGNNGATGEGTFKLGVIKDGFSVFIRALDDVTDTTVLARPKVMCLNRQRARIHVGRDVGYLTSTVTDTSTTQAQDFLPTGIELVFRPFIAPNGMIRMELNPSLSDAVARDVQGFDGQPVTVQDKTTNNIITNVRVRDGETIVLGGFFQEKSVIARKQVPLLGDIPIAGNMFRGQDDDIDRVEIIFLLTPRVIRDEQLYEMGQESLEIMDTVRVGVRSGLLPWSRDQMTANYNHDALQAYRDGELDLALFYANASLRQDTSQPEMHRFREQLSGERMPHWERSMNQRILMREMELIPADRLDVIEPEEQFQGDDRPVPAPSIPTEEPQKAASAGDPAAGATLESGLTAATFGEGHQ